MENTEQKQTNSRPYVYAKNAEVRELHNQSNEAVKEVIGNDPVNALNILDTAEKYGTSIRNAALIQKELNERKLDGEALKSYEDWQKDNLQVRKGQKGIAVIEPRKDEKGNIAMTKVNLFPASATNAKKTEYKKLASDQFQRAADRLGYPNAKQFNEVAKYYHLSQTAKKETAIRDNANELVENYLSNRESFVKHPNAQNTELEKSLVQNRFLQKLDPYRNKEVQTKRNEATKASLEKWTNKDGKHFAELDGKEQAKILTSATRTYNKLTYGMRRVMKQDKDRQLALEKKKEMERE